MVSESIPETAELSLARARELYHAGRYAEGAAFTAAAVAAHPQAPDLWNVHGVMLRQLRRPQEALAALDRALGLTPGHLGARTNRASVLLDLGDATAAEPVFAELSRADPANAGHRLGLGRARLRLGRREAGLVELREATRLQPGLAAAWLQLADALEPVEGPAAAEAVLAEALSHSPESLALLEGKALVLRTSGQAARAEAFLHGLVDRFPDEAWIHLHLGDLEAERDPAAGEARLRRAYELDPQSAGPRIALAQRLARVTGPDEGRALDEAYGLATAAVIDGLTPNQAKVVRDVFSRVCDFAAIERLGDFSTLGRRWASAGAHTALFRHLPRVAGQADRLELLEQHRIAGAQMAAAAERRPIVRPASRAPGAKIRLGLLSSDLRRHPVGYFVEPLFEHLDPGRFEVFCYAFDRGPADDLQAAFIARAAAFRRMPEASARDAAQAIADDDLDLLIELGGSTSGNRLEVLAWRPAPRQASWLGYPHSAGLAAIDGLIVDPFNTPADRSLLLETPLVMPRSWIALGAATFNDEAVIEPELPEARTGALTFGTANNTYKYTAASLQAWAQVTAAVPGARFAFIRPEGASAAFREHVTAAFAAEGVEAGRVAFHAVRGGHLPHYNQIDISLDTFPLTGGTTTVEALWMGVPVVSLKGPAFYERLSWSILANAGVGDLVADDLAGFRRIALDLAADRGRRTELRASLRQRLRASPLGDTAAFARDFYDLIERTVRGG
ncbi:MAG: tetratricopeptide repeat protein [Phenylobacterium sp.]|nr:MAG: tetratricopeptide repeat protein [Phenylobacterium sp.]